MTGKRTPDSNIHPAGGKYVNGSTDDDVSLREHVQRQLDASREYTTRIVEEQREFFLAILAERKDRVELAFGSLTLLLDERATNADKNVRMALDAAKEAVTKAEHATEKRFECVAADTPILCADLVWRPAGDLLVGDELLAFDETHPDRRGRRLRRALVTANSIERDALLRINTPVGDVRCNHEHPWLVRRTTRSNWQWVKARDLRAGDVVKFIMDTWETDRSWQAGWLAGLYDGEGCLMHDKNHRVQLSVTQRESPTSDRLDEALKAQGVRYGAYRVEAPGGKRQPMFHFIVTRRADILKVLGRVRPPRLLDAADKAWEGRVMGGWGQGATISSVEDAGSGLIASLSTSTHTYIAGGFAMHNSVNEFRQTLTDQAATFMPRGETEVRMGALAERVDSNAQAILTTAAIQSERISKLELDVRTKLATDDGKGLGLKDAWGYLIGAAGFIALLVSFYQNKP